MDLGGKNDRAPRTKSDSRTKIERTDDTLPAIVTLPKIA